MNLPVPGEDNDTVLLFPSLADLTRRFFLSHSLPAMNVTDSAVRYILRPEHSSRLPTLTESTPITYSLFSPCSVRTCYECNNQDIFYVYSSRVLSVYFLFHIL
jgi:hypothetical protein